MFSIFLNDQKLRQILVKLTLSCFIYMPAFWNQVIFKWICLVDMNSGFYKTKFRFQQYIEYYNVKQNVCDFLCRNTIGGDTGKS
jgi:hypothetical protein